MITYREKEIAQSVSKNFEKLGLFILTVDSANVTGRARGIVRHLILLRANRVQKVRILAETVTILTNVVVNLALVLELFVPLVDTVVRFGRLQATQNLFVVVGDSGDFLYSDGAVERVVGIKAAWVRLWFVCERVRRGDVLRWLQVDLKHLAKQNPILVLNLTHTLYFAQKRNGKFSLKRLRDDGPSRDRLVNESLN